MINKLSKSKYLFIGLISGIILSISSTFVFAEDIVETLTAIKNAYPIFVNNTEVQDIDAVKIGDYNYIKAADISRLFENASVSFNETKQQIEINIAEDASNSTSSTNVDSTNDIVIVYNKLKQSNPEKFASMHDYVKNGIPVTLIDGKEYCRYDSISSIGGSVIYDKVSNTIFYATIGNTRRLENIPYIIGYYNKPYIEYNYVINTLIPFAQVNQGTN